MKYDLVERMQTITIAGQRHDRRTAEDQAILDRAEDKILTDELARIERATQIYSEQCAGDKR